MQELSLENYKIVHGIKVKKLYMGKYLMLAPKILNFQKDLMQKIFGNNAKNDILDNILNLDTTSFFKTIENALAYAPEMVINFIVEILEVDKEEFINNENIGLYELIEIVEAFFEVNRVGELMEKVNQLIQKQKEKIQNIGYKPLSHLD